MTQTQSGRYTFKPNITQQPFLYRGQCVFNATCKPKAFQEKDFSFLKANVLREEFELVMESHPLYRLFKKGIRLSDTITLKIENPYGLAMSYGFPTVLLPLTSSLDIASFFAVTRYDEANGSFQCVGGSEQERGSIAVFKMNVPFGVTRGLSVVGWQPFPRPGLQKTFAMEVPFNTNFHSHPFVDVFTFRHDDQESKKIFTKFEGGRLLFPKKDPLARKAHEVLNANTVSYEAFERNIKDNPLDDRRENLKKLEELGLTVSESASPPVFSAEELVDYFEHIDEIWRVLASRLVFPGRKAVEYNSRFADIPNNPAYREYFIR